MSDKDLMDHAEELLTTIVSDMKSPQSNVQQSQKSKGIGGEGNLAKLAKARIRSVRVRP